MNEAPIELILAAFQDEKAADAALQQLKAAKREQLIRIEAAAVLRRDEKNKLHVKEVGELTPKKGALGGAVLGGVVGVLTGGTGLLLGALGAALGGFVGKKRDTGFDNRRLKTVGDALQPGTSAIVAVIEHKWVTELEEALEELGADVMTAAIAADIAEQLAAGKELSYSALASQDALSLERTAAGEDDVEHSSMTATDDAVTTLAAVANKEGVAYESTTTTEDGMSYEAGIITDDAAVVAGAVATEDGIIVGAIAAAAEDGEEAADEEEETQG